MTLMSALTSVLSYLVLRLIVSSMPVFLTDGDLLSQLHPDDRLDPRHGAAGGLRAPAVPGARPGDPPLAGIGAVQFVIGNVLLPRMSGDALNISLGVTIFALFGWGALWGVTGMFVAMPLTAMMIIAFSHFAATRPLASSCRAPASSNPPAAR